jgi:transcriptional regulator with XRE-family HTH domain
MTEAFNVMLRHRREALGWSQKRLAELMGTVQSSVSDLENGSNMTYATLLRWTDALGFDVAITDRMGLRRDGAS